MYDSYGNHVQQGTEVLLSLDGFCFQDNAGPKRKVRILFNNVILLCLHAFLQST